LAEIEAAEACRWMRAAGFPQYAQMYADHQFPVDLHAVQKDHPFLDRDALQALFRRLHALNKCARLQRIDGPSAATLAAQHNEVRAFFVLSAARNLLFPFSFPHSDAARTRFVCSVSMQSYKAAPSTTLMSSLSLSGPLFFTECVFSSLSRQRVLLAKGCSLESV
jgi:SAM domain (Sterile alpha motif)